MATTESLLTSLLSIARANRDTVLLQSVSALAAGAARSFDVRGAARLTVIPASGAIATLSRVDRTSATSHTEPTTVIEGETSVLLDWPFYRLSVAGGSCRYALIP